MRTTHTPFHKPTRAIDEPAFLKHYGVTSVAQLTTDKIASIDKAFTIKAKAKP